MPDETHDTFQRETGSLSRKSPGFTENPPHSSEGDGIVDNLPQKPTKRRQYTRLGCLALLLVALGYGSWMWWLSQRGWTAAQLEKLIQAELPANCDRASASAWFDQHGIGYNWWADTTGDSRGNRTMPELVGLKNSDLSGMLRGNLASPEANVGWFSTGRISIYFFFDKQGCRVGHLVDEFVYMP
jgi:hypothetical protein